MITIIDFRIVLLAIGAGIIMFGLAILGDMALSHFFPDLHGLIKELKSNFFAFH